MVFKYDKSIPTCTKFIRESIAVIFKISKWRNFDPWRHKGRGNDDFLHFLPKIAHLTFFEPLKWCLDIINKSQHIQNVPGELLESFLKPDNHFILTYDVIKVGKMTILVLFRPKIAHLTSFEPLKWSLSIINQYQNIQNFTGNLLQSFSKYEYDVILTHYVIKVEEMTIFYTFWPKSFVWNFLSHLNGVWVL